MSLWFELAILLAAILAFVSGQHSISWILEHLGQRPPERDELLDVLDGMRAPQSAAEKQADPDVIMER